MPPRGHARAEFDAVYPNLVTAAYRAVERCFRHAPSQIENAVAETMARTFERWERVRRHENPTGWVVVCAKKVCLEQVRANERNARSRSAEVDVHIDLADDTAVSITVTRVLGKRSKRQRDVAVLRYLMDCDEATTTAATGMSVSNVKTAAHEARRRLRPPSPTSTATSTRRPVTGNGRGRGPWDDTSIPGGIDAQRVYEHAVREGTARRVRRRRRHLVAGTAAAVAALLLVGVRVASSQGGATHHEMALPRTARCCGRRASTLTRATDPA